MGTAQRPLNDFWLTGPGKKKAQVLGTFRQGHELLSQVRGDRQIIDPGNPPGILQSADFLQSACGWNRDHHHTGRPGLPCRQFHLLVDRMADDQLLQRQAAAKRQQP